MRTLVQRDPPPNSYSLNAPYLPGIGEGGSNTWGILVTGIVATVAEVVALPEAGVVVDVVVLLPSFLGVLLRKGPFGDVETEVLKGRGGESQLRGNGQLFWRRPGKPLSLPPMWKSLRSMRSLRLIDLK